MKYTNQLCAFKKGTGNKKATLSVEDFLSIKAPTEDAPLELSPFSRYVVTILEVTGENHSVVEANIPIKDIYGMSSKMNRVLLHSMNNATPQTEANGVQEPKIFSIKEFAGQTPSQILASNPANKDKLLAHIPVLEQNMAKYPKNKDIIDAIKSACNGNMAEATPSVTSKYEIYHSDVKYFRKTNEKGLNKCYQITMTYDTAMQYPMVVEITNFFAPVVAKEGGQTLIQMSAKEGEIKKTFRLSENDAIYLIERMERNLKNFEMYAYSSQRKVYEANQFKPQS